MRNYRNIRAFQYADRLVTGVYRMTKAFPKNEMYGLTSQIRRAAVSIAANIVEGASRQHMRDYLNFLYISRSSLCETEYLIHLSNKLGYLEKNNFYALKILLNETHKVLFGLINAVTAEVKKGP